MDDRTKGYLEGLQAAALICQENAGDRNSHLSDKIMALHSKTRLRVEIIEDNNQLFGQYILMMKGINGAKHG
jgi:hypothetical protein